MFYLDVISDCSVCSVAGIFTKLDAGPSIEELDLADQEDFFGDSGREGFFLSKVCPGRVDAGIERGGGYFALCLRNSIKVCFHNVTGCVWILASEDKLVFQTSVTPLC